jgi:hypothetical protein
VRHSCVLAVVVERCTCHASSVARSNLEMVMGRIPFAPLRRQSLPSRKGSAVPSPCPPTEPNRTAVTNDGKEPSSSSNSSSTRCGPSSRQVGSLTHWELKPPAADNSGDDEDGRATTDMQALWC